MPACQKCHATFPVRKEIDGKLRHLGKRKFCLTCSPFGANNRRDLTLYQDGTKKCATCKTSKPLADFYARIDRPGRPPQSHCKGCTKIRMRDRLRHLKLRAIEYKGGACVKCGFEGCQAAFDFHHPDPKGKDFTISKANLGWKILKKELDKCDLVCANCHREIHFNMKEHVPVV